MVKITRVVDLRQQREGSALSMVEYQDSATGVIGGLTEYVLPGNLPKAGDTFDELGALYKKCGGEK